MGGAIAKNFSAAGWQVIGFDIDESAMRRGEGGGRRDRRRAPRRSPRRRRIILVSLPKPEALIATVEAIAEAKLPRRVDRGAFDVLARRQDRGRGRAARGRPYDARLSALAAPARRRAPRTSSSTRAATRRRSTPDAGVRRFLASGARSRRLRQRHEDEVRRQSAGGDPQRRERRGDGARHEGRARSGADLQADPGGRRQFARVRVARADDGRGPLRRRQSHHAQSRPGRRT